MSISRPPRLREQNILYGFVIKNRLGPDKLKFIGQMDTDYGQMELYNYNSDEARNILMNSTANQERAEKTRTLELLIEHAKDNDDIDLG